MNEDKFKTYHIVGVIFVLAAGVLLNFVYELSGGNNIAAVFGSVNESVWEHMKTLFWPMLIFIIIEFFAYGKEYSNFFTVKATSLLVGLLTIPVLYYTYSGIIGKNYLVIDILIFVIAVVAAYLYSYFNLDKQEQDMRMVNILGFVVIVLLTACFIVFTFIPPHIGLFYDTTQGLYGIK